MKKNEIFNTGSGFILRTKNKLFHVYLTAGGISTLKIVAALPKEELHFNGNKIIKGKVKQTGFGLTDDAVIELHAVLSCFIKYRSKIEPPKDRQ